MASKAELQTARSNAGTSQDASYPISVVIPAHNAIPELRQCLDALFQNDLANTEILVVDDGSSEGLDALISTLSPGSSIVLRSLRIDQHSGPAVARNKGLEEAKYPHVLFVDADVVLPEQSVAWIRETLHLYAHLPEIAGVLGVYSEVLPCDDFSSNFKNLYTCYLYEITDTRSPFLHTPILCVKKELVERAGGFDPKLHRAEDFRLGVALGSQGYRFIIDRRVRGTHLKRYSLAAILKEDRKRIRDLRKIKIPEGQKKFYYRAHRWSRLLSVLLPGPILIFTGLILLNPGYGVIALLLLLIFYLCSAPFLSYCRRFRGWVFAVKAAGFLFVEMLWAEVSLLFSGKSDGDTTPTAATASRSEKRGWD